MTPIDYNNPNEMWRHNDYDPYKGMSDEERIMAGCLQVFIVAGAFIVALLICALFSSCTTTQYVPVIEHKTDTVLKYSTKRDSIWLHDSISVKEKGDTVRIEKWHTKYVSKEVHDTTCISKTDSVPVPYEVIKEVPAQLTWWQQTRLYLANILLYLILIVGIIYVGKKHIKRLRGE